MAPCSRRCRASHPPPSKIRRVSTRSLSSRVRSGLHPDLPPFKATREPERAPFRKEIQRENPSDGREKGVRFPLENEAVAWTRQARTEAHASATSRRKRWRLSSDAVVGIGRKARGLARDDQAAIRGREETLWEGSCIPFHSHRDGRVVSKKRIRAREEGHPKRPRVTNKEREAKRKLSPTTPHPKAMRRTKKEHAHGKRMVWWGDIATGVSEASLTAPSLQLDSDEWNHNARGKT